MVQTSRRGRVQVPVMAATARVLIKHWEGRLMEATCLLAIQVRILVAEFIVIAARSTAIVTPKDTGA